MPIGLELVLSVVEKVCVVATAIIALSGLTAWRAEMLGRKKADLAEEVLAGFYETRDIFAFVRNHFSNSSEGESRKANEGEDEGLRRIRNAYFVPIARLMQHNVHFGKLQSLKYRCMAYFGPTAEKPFNELNSIKNAIVIDASTLIEADPDESLPSEEIKAMKATIGWCRTKDDLIRPRIEQMIFEIEAICGTYLRDRK